MPIPLNISNQVYNYPEPGDPPGWGEDSTGAMVALVDKVNSISPTTDIVSGSVSLANNIVVPTAVVTLSFDSSLTIGAVIEYSLVRTATSFNKTDIGRMTIGYSDGVWYMGKTIEAGEDTEVVFSINNSGQVLYTSSNLTGTHSATLKFRTRTFNP